MTKKDLSGAVADRTGMPASDAASAVDAVLDSIGDALGRGEEVTLTGWGKFTVAEREAREGRNPRTGETQTFAATRTPKFKAGAKLKETVAAAA